MLQNISHDESMNLIAITARWIIPIVRPPIEDGFVLLRGSKILAVGTRKDLNLHWAPEVIQRDFGDAVVLPALINAHVHLELSDCRTPFPVQPGSMVSWIQNVIVHRQARGGYSPQGVARGWEECLQFGVTAVGDIAQPGSSPEHYFATLTCQEEAVTPTCPLRTSAQSDEKDSQLEGPKRAKFPQSYTPPGERKYSPNADLASQHALPAKGVVFLEIIAPLEEKAGELLGQALEFLNQPFPDGLSPGLAPHAPYTVAPTILVKLIEEARRRQLPVAFHLAESREELRLLQEGKGPFRDLLESRGLWRPGIFGKRAPIFYLRELARAPRAIVVHGNYLRDEELDFLAHNPHVALVFCPRTHKHFGHEPYPLEKAFARSIRVAIGSDSRASCPDLNLMEDLREICRTFPGIAPSKILCMATVDAAAALGCEGRLGSLEPGKDADLLVYPLPVEFRADPFAAILGTSFPPIAFIRSGKTLPLK
jgi:cytosine/adenosine deaminase-related metal-dependent hydrolase